MDLNYLKKLIKIFDDSSATDLEIEEEGVKFKISRHSQDKKDYIMPNFPIMQFPSFAQQPFQQGMPSYQLPVQQEKQTESKEIESVKNELSEEKQELLHEISSPIVGTFYRAPSPDSDPFVEIGSHVSRGTTLCIVEAMKLMNEIESDVSGTVVKILVENTKPVEYNQLLFLIKPD